jgi:hypothetical protein
MSLMLRMQPRGMDAFVESAQSIQSMEWVN